MQEDCIDHKKKGIKKGGYYVIRAAPYRGVYLHRLIYCQNNNKSLQEIDGFCVMHTCDNPRCINPNHLVLGTWADNNKDRANKNRSAKYVLSRRKITQEQAEEIKLRFSKRKGRPDLENGVMKIAKDYNVDSGVVYNIIKGKSHFENPIA